MRDHRVPFLDGAPYTERLGDLTGAEDRVVLLGDRAGTRYAARAVGAEEAERLAERTGARFENLRTVIVHVPGWQGGLLAYAAALLAWHERSRFCGSCGAPTRSERAGHQRVCTAEGCARPQFPRTDPAIITLVRRGDRALLVHQPAWPAGRVSTLAGFVEPGESLEQAVAREVAEEVGLRVARTEYFASQPWPFPHTLMVGYRTEVEEGGLVLGDELDGARWLTRREVRAALESGALTIPPPLSLSRSLIEDWLEG